MIPKEKHPEIVEPVQNGGIATKVIYLSKYYSRLQHLARYFHRVKAGCSPFCFTSSFFQYFKNFFLHLSFTLLLYFIILFFFLFHTFHHFTVPNHNVRLKIA